MYSRRSCFSNFHFFFVQTHIFVLHSAQCRKLQLGTELLTLRPLAWCKRPTGLAVSRVHDLSLSLSLSRNSCGSRCSATALREQASSYSAIWDPPSHVIVQSTRVCTDSTLLSFVVSYRVDYSRKRVFVVIMQVIVVAERVLFHLGGLWKKG